MSLEQDTATVPRLALDPFQLTLPQTHITIRRHIVRVTDSDVTRNAKEIRTQ